MNILQIGKYNYLSSKTQNFYINRKLLNYANLSKNYCVCYDRNLNLKLTKTFKPQRMNLNFKLFLAQVTGSLVIIVYLVMFLVFGLKMNDFKAKNPVITFEFASSQQQVYLIFNDQTAHLNTKLLKATDLFNKIDFLFALAYGSFLMVLFSIFKSLTRNKIYSLAIWLSLIAMVFDFAENTQLLQITAKLMNSENFAANIHLLQVFTWIKWSSLAVVLVIGGIFVVKQKSVLSKIIGIICFVPVLLLVPAMMVKSLQVNFAFTVVLGILGLLLFAFFDLKRTILSFMEG